MKRIIVLLGCMPLIGCVEVTRFVGPEQDFYLAQCGGPALLQSCRSALESTCPKGYDILQPATKNSEGLSMSADAGFFRCR